MTGYEKVYAPVIVFAYNREMHIRSCIESLANCDSASDFDVIVYSDGYKNDKDKDKVEAVRDYLFRISDNKSFKSFRVIERNSNYGLAKSVINGVTETLENYESVIVVEDDLILSKDFLLYMNGALDYYSSIGRYGSISAYTYNLKGLRKYKKDVYVLRKGDCWGWATWRDRWQKVDWELKDFESYLNDKKRRKDFSRLELGLESQLIAQHKGTLDAWAARWIFHLYNNNLVTVYPTVCRAINRGFDGSGQNCGNYDISNKTLSVGTHLCKFEDLKINRRLEREIGRMGRKGIISRFIERIRL